MDDHDDLKDDIPRFSLEKQLIPVLSNLTSHLLKDNKDFITSAMFKYVPPPKIWNDQNFDRNAIWADMIDHGLLNSTSSRGKGKDKKVPSMRPKQPLSALVQGRLVLDQRAREVIECQKFREVADVRALSVYLNSKSRCENATVLDEYLKDTLKDMSTGRRRGRADGATQCLQDHIEGEIRKLKDSEEQLQAIYAVAGGTSKSTRAAELSPSGSKRRRLRSIDDSDNYHAYGVAYHFTRDDIRTRRQASCPAAQRCSRVHQKILFPDTYDLDIHNCCFVILSHALKVLDPEMVPAVERTFLQRVSEDRKGICSEMGISDARGKLLLNKVFNGGAVPDDLQGNATLRGLQRLSHCMRWLAVDVLPDVCSAVGEERMHTHSLLKFHGVSVQVTMCAKTTFV